MTQGMLPYPNSSPILPPPHIHTYIHYTNKHIIKIQASTREVSAASICGSEDPHRHRRGAGRHDLRNRSSEGANHTYIRTYIHTYIHV